jgi:ribosomal protein L7Ae-like RNA K-turn-binding protein
VSGEKTPAIGRLRVSIALCTFNGARFLADQLDSLAAQTRQPDEIVIADDASSDDTFAMLERFAAASAVPVQLVRNPANLGFVGNFEATLVRTTGEILMPCDQDDVWQPAKIARLAQALEADGATMLAHCNARLIDADGQPTGGTMFGALRLCRRERRLVDRGQPIRAQLRRNLVTGAACAFRRIVLDHAKPFPAALAHDDWLATAAAMLGTITRIDTPLMDYRLHGWNQVGIPVRTLAGHIHARPDRDELEARARARLDLIETLATRLAQSADHRATALLAAALIEQHRHHLAVRAWMPKSHIARLPHVAAEALSGRYFECSNGWLSIARDLMDG